MLYALQEYKKTYLFKRKEPRLDTLDMVCWEGYAEWRTPLGRGDRSTNCGWKRDGNQQLLALWEPFLVLRSVPWRIGPRNLAIYLSSLHGRISTLSKGSLPPATRYLVLVCPFKFQDEVRGYFSHSLRFTLFANM